MPYMMRCKKCRKIIDKDETRLVVARWGWQREDNRFWRSETLFHIHEGCLDVKVEQSEQRGEK